MREMNSEIVCERQQESLRIKINMNNIDKKIVTGLVNLCVLVFAFFLSIECFAQVTEKNVKLNDKNHITTPYLISIQTPKIKEAWRQVSELIADNDKSPNPLPDPYLARAEIWTSVGSHEDAVEDYLTASRLIMLSDPSLIEQSRVFKSLRDSLERLAKAPQPVYPIKASSAFQKAVELYYHGQFFQASPLFAEATRLEPNDAVYRAFRALNYYKIGDQSSAEKQIAVAASIIRKPESINPNAREEDFHKRLERIQGPDRQWLANTMLSLEIVNKSLTSQADQFLVRFETNPK